MKENFYKTLEYYKKNKDTLSDEEKAKYLKTLLQVSKKLNVDLRKEIYDEPIEEKEEVQEAPKQIHDFSNYKNPIDDDRLLKDMLEQRYNNCSFNFLELYPLEDFEDFDSEPYKEQLKKLLTKYNITNIDDNIVFQKDHIGANIFSNEKPEFKISINTKNNKETYEFLIKYITKCLDNSLNYDMYGFINDYTNAHTILYATSKDLKQKTKILNEINLKNVDTPPANESIVTYYSISHLGITDKDGEIIEDYNTYFNELSEVAYYRVLAKLILTKIRTDEDMEIINDFISLTNVKCSNNNSPLQALYNKKTFNNIKDIVNRYIPDVSNTLRIYMSDEQQIKNIIDEFKKSMTYIVNAISKQPIKQKNNIALNH